MTYVSSFYHAFSGAQKVPGRARQAHLAATAQCRCCLSPPVLTSFLLQTAAASLRLEATPRLLGTSAHLAFAHTVYRGPDLCQAVFQALRIHSVTESGTVPALMELTF